MSTHNLKQKVEQLNLSKQTFINPPMHLLLFFFGKKHTLNHCVNLFLNSKEKAQMPCQLRMSVRSSKVIQHPWEMPILRFQHSPQTHHISLLKYLPKSWEVFCAWLCSCKQQTSTLMQTTDKIKLEADLISTSTVLLFWYLHSQGHWTWLKKSAVKFLPQLIHYMVGLCHCSHRGTGHIRPIRWTLPLICWEQSSPVEEEEIKIQMDDGVARFFTRFRGNLFICWLVGGAALSRRPRMRQ